MKLERFKAQIDNLQRGNRYNVAMFGTGAKNGGLSIRGIKCESATLPGKGFFTVEESEYGPKRAIPHKPQYDAFDCSFLLDNSFEDRELIELWMSTINGNAEGNFHSRFHDDYTGIIMVEALDKQDNVNYRCVMTDAFPVQLGVVNLGNENGDITKFNAQFRYRYWHGEFTNSKPSNLFMGFMDKHLSKFSNKIKGKIEDKIFG
jgi:hypothetical protein|tara:strand:+ start:1329 stop:1940 length:612 start_codon:yes stop_codon:yes gene_type:complete